MAGEHVATRSAASCLRARVGLLVVAGIAVSLPAPATIAANRLSGAKRTRKPSSTAVLRQRVVKLKPGGVLPDDAFRLGAKSLARALVKRQHQSIEAKGPRSKRRSRRKIDWHRADIEVRIHISRHHLYENLRDGRKNLHQTGTSNGDIERKKRRTIEREFLHVRWGANDPDAVKSLLPKYGIVVPQKPLPGFEHVATSVPYGDVVLVLKNSIKSRTTMHLDDSLLATGRRRGAVFTFDSEVDRTLGNATFLEAQIWGPVTREDIDHILVPPDFDPSVLRAVRAFGVPIYHYRTSTTQINKRLSYSVRVADRPE